MARPRGTPVESSRSSRPRAGSVEAAASAVRAPTRDDLPPASTQAREAPLRGGARPGAGRPPIDPSERRSERITVRLTEATLATLTERAEREGVTVSELAADALEAEARQAGQR